MSGGGRECYACGWPGPDTARYCIRCGSSLEVPRCTGCLRPVAPGSQFCGRCGVPIDPGNAPVGTPAPEEQIRQVTVLFGLLSGLRILVEQCEPEEFKELLEDCFRTLTAEAVARGGTIDKYLADSLLVVFGVPVAHEDDPVRAVAAALGMLEAMEAFNRRLFRTRGFQLELKLGINTGKVLVGYVGDRSRAMTVMGDVVNTASRVEHAAPVGGILVCESTRRGLGEQFRLRSQPPLVVKGKAQPLTVYRVLRQRTGGGEAGVDPSLVPLVGRERELDQLVLVWRRLVRPGPRGEGALAAAGAWVTVLGEVGLGKERLLYEFQRYVSQDPLRPGVHRVRGTSLATGAGSEVLRRLVGSLAGVLPHDDGAAEAERILELAQKIAGVDPETGEPVRADFVARSIYRLIGLAAPDAPEQGLPTMAPRSVREQGIGFLKALCWRLAEERPMVIMATDLQWAHDAALDFFEALGADPPPRVMLITSGRPSLLSRRPGWGEASNAHTTLTLEPLNLSATQALVREMVGERRPAPPGLAEALFKFTGGNPFFLTETLRDYLETCGEDDAGHHTDKLAVPDSIEGVLQSRLDRLSFEEGLTLRAAALIGPVFWGGAVAAVLGSQREDALEHLCEAGFIQRRERSSLPGEAEYAFDHVLTAKVAAGNLLESVRHRYHRAAAEWLAARNSVATPIELGIAHHFEAAGMLARAVPYLGRAGDRALAAYDCVEAVRLFDRALKGFDEAPSELQPALRAHLLAQRGEARRMLAEFAPALSDFQAAAAASLEVGDLVGGAAAWYRAGLVHLALGHSGPASEAASAGDRMLQGQTAPAITAVGLHLRSELLMAAGRHLEARQTLERALTIWRKNGDRWALAHGLNTLGRLQSSQADYRAAQRAFREAAGLREALGDTFGLATTLGNLGATAERMGNFPEALGHFHRSLRLHRRTGNQPGVASTLMNQGVGYTRCGYYRRAQVALEEALDLNETLGRAKGIWACQGNLGHLWLRLGRLSDASRYLTEAVVGARSAGDEVSEAEFLVDLADCRLREGAIDAGAELAEQALARVRREAGGDAEARVLQLLCAVALARGEVGDALQYVEELEWNEANQMTPELQMDTALLAGRIHLLEQRPAVAAARFQEAERIARDHDLTPGQWEARVYLQRALRLAGDPAEVSAAAAATEAFRELLARVEDAELIRILQGNASQILQGGAT